MADPAYDETAPNSSTDSAFAVLRLFASAPGPLSVTEIARSIGLPLSTTHRVVSTLTDTEYLERHRRSGEYQPGLRVRELLSSMHARFPLRAASTPTLRQLASESRQAAVLQVRFGDRSLRVCGISDHQIVHRPLLIGQAEALHQSPGGRVILAFQPPGFRADYLARLDKPVRGLTTELATVRSAAVLEHVEAGLRSIAFPVRVGGGAVGAIVLEGSPLTFGPPEARLITRWRDAVAALEEIAETQADVLSGPFAEALGRSHPSVL